VFFFELSTWLLLVLLFVVIVGATVIGLLVGRAVRDKSEDLREPFSVMQAALLGFMGSCWLRPEPGCGALRDAPRRG
jgi:hypothetical protein